MRATVSIALALVLCGGSYAAEKKEGPPIRVCVAAVQNTSRRSVNLALMRDRLIRDLKDAKAPKKAADQRRILALPLEEGAGAENSSCDFTVNVNVIELRQKTDPLWQSEKDKGIGNLPSPGSRNEEVTYGEVRFKLRSGGGFTPVVDDTISGEETSDENGTVGLLLDRVAQRVNSAVREPARTMSE